MASTQFLRSAEGEEVPQSSCTSGSKLAFVFIVLGVVTTPLRAQEAPSFVTQKIGSHSYVIPRDLIVTIFKPDYSGVRNPNPNWSRDPAVRLAVQWPEFATS